MFWGQTPRLGLRLDLGVKVKGQGQRSMHGATGQIELERAGICCSQGLLFSINGLCKVGEPSMDQGQRSLSEISAILHISRLEGTFQIETIYTIFLLFFTHDLP